MKIVFMGTPDFAVPCLERLLQDGHEIPLVVTRADQPRGRGHKMAAPPVKEAALAHGLTVYQPAGVKSDEAFLRLQEAQPDLIVVVAYGRILPLRVLQLPRFGCINIHASLLPRYRGAAPIQWAVLNGETTAGVTSMQMAEGLDTGDMLLSRAIPVPSDMTGGALHDALSVLGAEVLAQTLQALADGTLTATPQVDADSTYAPMLDKSLSPMDFARPAAQLHNQVRGLNPWPSASCLCNGRVLKVHRTHVGKPTAAAAGTVTAVEPFTVACGDGCSLVFDEVQPEGSRRMATADFLRGHPVAVGTVLQSGRTDGVGKE